MTVTAAPGAGGGGLLSCAPGPLHAASAMAHESTAVSRENAAIRNVLEAVLAVGLMGLDLS